MSHCAVCLCACVHAYMCECVFACGLRCSEARCRSSALLSLCSSLIGLYQPSKLWLAHMPPIVRSQRFAAMVHEWCDNTLILHFNPGTLIIVSIKSNSAFFSFFILCEFTISCRHLYDVASVYCKNWCFIAIVAFEIIAVFGFVGSTYWK